MKASYDFLKCGCSL